MYSRKCRLSRVGAQLVLASAAALAASGSAQAADTAPTATAPAGQAQQGASTMTWSNEEIREIVNADDLHISPFREDGATFGTPTWIWCVTVDGALYVRAYNGRNSRWHQAAIREKAGRITAAGMAREVSFDPVDGPINDRIDDAYRAKYRGSQYLEPMLSERSRAATVRITPRVR